MNSCDDHHGTSHDQHLRCFEFTGAATIPEHYTVKAEATNEFFSSKPESLVPLQVLNDTFATEAAEHQPLKSNAAGVPRPLTFLPKIQNNAAEASPFRNSYHYQAFLLSGEMLVKKGCIKLAGVIRRAAVVCFAPWTGADEEEEDDLPYSQLDKVTHAPKREAFGPLYLVT